MPVFHAQCRRGFCRWCGEPVLDALGHQNKRCLWHKPCLHVYFIHTDTSYAAAELIKLHGLVCACCKLDLAAVQRSRADLASRKDRGKFWKETKEAWEQDVAAAIAGWDKLYHELRALGFKDKILRGEKKLYEIDHIRPVWLSGGKLEYFALDNQQILCLPCHATKTREDMKARRWQKAIIQSVG